VQLLRNGAAACGRQTWALRLEGVTWAEREAGNRSVVVAETAGERLRLCGGFIGELRRLLTPRESDGRHRRTESDQGAPCGGLQL
jgi:hypothetical protein